MKDLIIIGGGPAGTAAAVYAARKQLKTLIITEEFGGQSAVSEDIKNWVGTPSISGADLSKSFRAHVDEYIGEFLELHLGERVQKVEKIDGGFSVKTPTKTFETKTIAITTGSTRRKLEVPGAEEFEHRGLTYCASCDGPVFSGQDVVVIGGGNAGFESAAQLLAYCKTVTIIHRNKEFKADPITVEKVLAHDNVIPMPNWVPTEVKGDKFVNGLTVKNKDTDEEKTLPVTGVFVEIGLIPTTDYVEELVEMNPIKQIIVDPKTQRTSVDGIWAAGDCTDGLYHQNNIAAGDAVKALEDLYQWIKMQ
jgi:NADH-dependent peroxiredoxin subunit F